MGHEGPETDRLGADICQEREKKTEICAGSVFLGAFVFGLVVNHFHFLRRRQRSFLHLRYFALLLF